MDILCVHLIIMLMMTFPFSRMLYPLPISSVSKGRRKVRGSRAVVSLCSVLPVLIEVQVEISLKGAVGTGEGRARGFGPLSMTYNLIWPEFGMHPLVRAGKSLRECFRACLLPLSFRNKKQFADPQRSPDDV